MRFHSSIFNAARGESGITPALFTTTSRRPNWLWGAALLYGLAVTARFIGIAVDGPPEGVAAPVIVELVLVALLVFGARKLPQAG